MSIPSLQVIRDAGHLKASFEMLSNPIGNFASRHLYQRGRAAMLHGVISFTSGLVLLAAAQASTLRAECDHIQGTKLGQYFRPGSSAPSSTAGPDAMTDFRLTFTFNGDQPNLMEIATSIAGSRSLMTKTLPIVLRREWIVVANDLVGASDDADAQNADFWSYALYPGVGAGIFIRHLAMDSRKATRGLSGREIAGEVFEATCRFTQS
jgi:hypothetical protein